VAPEFTDPVEVLLAQRQDQGFDTPSETVTEQLARLLAAPGAQLEEAAP
jgi:hypothetical protein